MNTNELISVSNAARMLNAAEPTVRLAADRGRLRCVRDSAGRRLFSLRDLKKYRRRLLSRRLKRERAIA